VRLRAFLLAGAFAVASATPALAIKEWYDYYLDARDRLIPAKRWDEAILALREAERLKPGSAVHEQLYGLEFEDYFPYYYTGLCYLEGKGDTQTAQRQFSIEESLGAIKKNEARYADLKRLRKQALDLESERAVSHLREEVDRLLREAADLLKARKYDDALARLALAQGGSAGIDPGRQQQIRDLTERIRAEMADVQASDARSKRIDDALQDGRRLLGEGHPSEAIVRFDEVLNLDPRNAKAADGKKEAEGRILASTTRQSREASLNLGKSLTDQGRYEEALRPLTDAAADPQDAEAQRLLHQAQKVVEGLREARDKREKVDRLLAQGEANLERHAYPEAAVVFGSVLQIDPSNVRARDHLAQADHLNGQSLLEKLFPNQKPVLNFFEPKLLTREDPTVAFIGVATDDHGIASVEFRENGRLLDTVSPRLADVTEDHRNLTFERTFPLSPGVNSFVVTTTDDMGLSTEQPFRIVRNLRFVERPVFFPAALLTALGVIGLGALVQRARRQRALRNRFNPYIAGAPILDEEMFFGRDQLTARILNVLHHNSLMITGERRIGKTTFLYHLGKALEHDDETEYKFFPVFTDLQGVPEQVFFHAVMEDVVQGLGLSEATLGSLRFPKEGLPYDGRDFGHDLQKVIEELKSRTPKRARLALLIDEVDILNTYSERINQRLRSIFMKTFAEHLVAVMSGVGIKRTWKSEGSPWYNFFDEVEITGFTRAEAEALIKTPVQGIFRYEPDAVEAILERSALRPYVIQKFCVHAVNRILEQGRVVVTLSDIEAVQGKADVEAEEHVEEETLHAP
jgi:tetratricopeptide (TPR) repeat protein